MKIVFITASMGGGGSERVIAELANQFVQEAHEVTILMTAGSTVSYTLDSRIVIRQIGQQTQGSFWKRCKRIHFLRQELKNFTDGCAISFGTETNMFSILAAQGMHLTLIASERNDPNQCTYSFLRDLIYSMGDKFAFQTNDARACFSLKIQKKSIVIPNPITPDIPVINITGREKKIVSVGRLTSQKNHKLMLVAFSKFCRQYSDYKLVLYGEGELEDELKQYAEKLQIAEKVEFAGFHKDVLNQIKSAAMYVLSSDYEGISNSLLEAMAMGLPVISTDCPIGGSKMCIQNEVNGLLVPVGDAEALSRAMIKIAESSEWAEKMGQEAVKVREKFSVANIARQWLEFGEKK